MQHQHATTPRFGPLSITIHLPSHFTYHRSPIPPTNTTPPIHIFYAKNEYPSLPHPIMWIKLHQHPATDKPTTTNYAPHIRKMDRCTKKIQSIMKSINKCTAQTYATPLCLSLTPQTKRQGVSYPQTPKTKGKKQKKTQHLSPNKKKAIGSTTFMTLHN